MVETLVGVAFLAVGTLLILCRRQVTRAYLAVYTTWFRLKAPPFGLGVVIFTIGGIMFVFAGIMFVAHVAHFCGSNGC